MTAPSSSSVQPPDDGVVVLQPRRLDRRREVPAAQQHVLDRVMDEVRAEVEQHAARTGVTVAGEVGVRVVVEAFAKGYERKPGDGLTDEQWDAMVQANGGGRPLAYVKSTYGAVEA